MTAMDRLSTKGQMIDQIDLRGVPHSGFDRSNHNYGTGRLGTIQPTRLDEVYPGDRIKGKPEVVINFEPLAAPLMGSMVVKQESFFVAYIQLWRHAYKFFTGKNGFNEPMPSVSPKDIFATYNKYIHKYIWSTIGAPIGDDSCALNHIISSLSSLVSSTDFRDTYSSVSYFDSPLVDDFKYFVEHASLTFESVYESRKMLDLVQPALDIFKRYSESDDLVHLSNQLEDDNVSLATKAQLCIDFALVLGGMIHQFFDYFHGPSSLFDYLGWPIPSKFELPETPLVGPYYSNVKNDPFKWVVLSNVLTYGSVQMLTYVNPLFSEVPLVFNPFKAYYLIWYWNYRDQLLETDILDPEEDEFLGSEITENVILYTTIMRQRCWFKDTFTTALTNTGNGNLLVPVGGPMVDTNKYKYYSDNDELIETTDAAAAFAAGATICEISSGSINYRVPMNYLVGSLNGSTEIATSNNDSFVSLELFDRIKRLREQVQKRLILGYEVDDVIWSSFMVRLTNVRMHIPEILGRGRDAVQINTIVNNTSTDQQIAGDKTATAWAHGQHSEMDYFAEEWGLYLSFITIMPIQSYAGGMQRLYLKRDPLDYMWPEFANLGMDAVYNCELAALGTRLTDAEGLTVFGYQGRYYDLKSRQDEEHGRLLTDLNYLTFSREWDSNNPPKLNYIFVHCWPRLDGFVLDDPSQDVFRYDCYNAQGWERRLPVPSEIVG